MKIAIASSKLEHLKRGVETWSRNAVHALKAKNINATLFKGSGKNTEGEISLNSIKQESQTAKNIMRWMPKFAWRLDLGNAFQLEETTFAWNLVKELKKGKYDIVHTKDAHVANVLRRAYRLRRMNTKVILGHGTEESWRFLKKFQYVQHLAPHHLDEAVKHCGQQEGWFMVPNFVDTNKFQPGDNFGLRTQLGIPDEAFVIMSVAAIKKTHKRFDYLIKDFLRLEGKAKKEVYLVIVGARTDQTQEILDLAKGHDHIKFLMDKPFDDLPMIYHMADLFVLCSLKEMFGTVILEAMASGLPCLVHQYPVFSWITSEGGYTIDMEQEGAVAAKIKRLIEERELLKDKGQRARDQACRNFSMTSVTEQMIKMYRAVLELPPTS